ncbi:Hrp-dependent type III effector protein [Enterococcus florum]|uniref:Hrp-dependent type III effector protein n=1 Tax=Enterococcus florum TaxID=2480627 RepID=A0A4P5PFQ3_9ENTE|nr:four-carbon acid sugar kinase family protein [Enterococcus florum]GCF95088.1 Hrp-dependent type III effector protein [Enterococcus florum]
MLKLLVIADDFTGALDTGVQFSNQGIHTLVSTETDLTQVELEETVEVLVINTESRYVSFEEAYEQMVRIIVSAQREKIPYIYKKVDSALRGNISAEVKAVLDASQAKSIPFLPAYPEMKRVLIDGDLYIDQQLVAESVFAEDPFEPVTESNLIRRLEQEAGIKAKLVKGSELPHNKQGVLVFDAQTDRDLENQLTALHDENLLSVTIGCAGFAKMVAKQLFPRTAVGNYTLKKPLVVVCGSVNPITKKQIEHADKKAYPRISLTPQQLLQPGYWAKPEGKQEIQRYLKLMQGHSLLVFETLSEQTMSGIKTYSVEQSLPVSDYRFRIGKSLGELTQALWTSHSENTFLFTGGDTLFQSMQVLGVKTIRPLAELNAGIVLSTIEWNQKARQVITKSGGFGNEELFEEISRLNETIGGEIC